MFYFLFSSFDFKKSADKLSIQFRVTILITFIVFIALAALHLYYNQSLYGSWKKIGQSSNFQRYRIGDYEQLIQKRADFQAAPTVTTSDQIFKEDLIINGGFTLLFGPDKGIFLFSPILLLGLFGIRSEEHTSELQSPDHLVCRLLLEKKKYTHHIISYITH